MTAETARIARAARTARAVGLLAAVIVGALGGACSSSSDDAGASGSSGASGTSGSSGSSGADASTVGVPSSCNGNDGPAPPTDPAALLTWLNTGAYKCWARESTQHPSDGPHGGEVKVFLNAKLDASLNGSAEHPEGAVSVKEFFPSGGKDVNGWAVMIKTQASSASGAGWYWYEVFGTEASARTIEGQGKTLCVNCHAAGGKDYVLTRHPLR